MDEQTDTLNMTEQNVHLYIAPRAGRRVQNELGKATDEETSIIPRWMSMGFLHQG